MIHQNEIAIIRESLSTMLRNKRLSLLGLIDLKETRTLKRLPPEGLCPLDFSGKL
jgi:hypothetical protein